MSGPKLLRGKTKTGEPVLSEDGGKTWHRAEAEPAAPAATDNLGVTGPVPKVPGATPPTPDHAAMIGAAAAKGRGEPPPEPTGERPLTAIEKAEADLKAAETALVAGSATPAARGEASGMGMLESVGVAIGENPIVRGFGRGLTSGFAPKLVAAGSDALGKLLGGVPDVERATKRGMDSEVMTEEQESLAREQEQVAAEEQIRADNPWLYGGGELGGAGVQAYLGARALGGAAKAIPGLAQAGSRLVNPIMSSLGPITQTAVKAAPVLAGAGAIAGVGYGDPERPASERAAEGSAEALGAGAALLGAGKLLVNPILGAARRHGEKAWQKMQRLNEPGGEQVRAFAEAGGQPASPLYESLGGESGTFRPTPAMKRTMERAEMAPEGAGSFGDLAYDDITSGVMKKIDDARAKTMADVTQVTEDLAARYPRPVSMEPLREHVNAAMAQFHKADPTASDLASAARKRGNIQGAAPGDDYALLSPESDIAFSFAPTLRKVADSLLRRDPAEFEVLLGGSANEQAAARTAVGRPRRQPSVSRGGAAVDELADDAVELEAVGEAESASRRKAPPPVPEVVAKGPTQRYAQYNLRNLIQLRQEIDAMSQFESGRGGRGVAALRALGGKVREMIGAMVSPDDLALIEQQSEQIAQMKARARTFGVSGNDALDLTPHSKDWMAVNAALKGDTRAMRQEALKMGPEAMGDIRQARGTAAYEGLEKGTAGDETRALGSMALAASGSRLALPAAVRGALLRPRRAGLMHIPQNPILAPPGARMFTGSQAGRVSQRKKDEEKRP